MSTRRRSFWGWGYEDARVEPAHADAIAELLAKRFGCEKPTLRAAPSLESIDLPNSDVRAPKALEAVISTDRYDRAGHTYGKAFRDVVRGLKGDFRAAPAAVAFPRSEADLVALLDWCSSVRLAAIPYGGGSSVCGGVEARLPGGYRGAISIDLSKLDRVLEIDRTSRAARIQAGIFGPALEDALRPQGLTLRHFPQSFEFSTLGGWIATRSGGHYATLYTHIDDFVESLRVVTPAGVIETRRLPGSGAGPSPDRMFLGSEGTLGVITEAWMRLQDRPRFRVSTAVTFTDYQNAHACVRALSQTGLFPTNLRLLDADEALTSGAGDGSVHVLILGFESADHSLDAWAARALECCRDHRGNVPEGAGKTRSDDDASKEGAAGAWRNAFLRAPYLRDALAQMGFVCETFETAITWDRFADFHARVSASVRDALRRVCGGGTVTCRFTHVYPDGPAPYFSVMAPGKPGSQLVQWDEIKAAASDAIIDAGGTITHHHAVGRDHRPGYDRQRPELFADALRAAKRTLDPAAVLNPGVLFDPCAFAGTPGSPPAQRSREGC
jgi:alkyldihydroxyacetonephosphate synthase